MATKTTEKTSAQAALELRQAKDAHLQALTDKAAALATTIEGARLRKRDLEEELSTQRFQVAHGDASSVDVTLKSRIAALSEEIEEAEEMLGHLEGSRKAADAALAEADAAYRRALGDEKYGEYERRITALNEAGRAYESAWAAVLESFKETREYKDNVQPVLTIAKNEILMHQLTFPTSPYDTIRLPDVGRPRYL